MNTYCGANCECCQSKAVCKGCTATCGSPFGGSCVAAEYIKSYGLEAYKSFKNRLTEEINTLLSAEGIPAAENLFELAGRYVNPEYPLPNGCKVKFLNDNNIYLGTQIESGASGIYYGVITDATFILICRYGGNGSDPDILLYRKR